MTKKIHTIQSSDKKEFDKEVNQFLESGGELMDGGYQVINDDDGVVYSQVVVFKDNLKVEFYENGRIKKLDQLNNDGELDGLWIGWYENGQKEFESTWKEGHQHGLCTQWYENGQKDSEHSIKNYEYDGLRTQWYENGQKSGEWNYKNGKYNGLCTEWYKNGQKKEEVNWKEGIQHGLTTKWYENGQKNSEGTFEDGHLSWDRFRCWKYDGSVIFDNVGE